MAATGLDLLWRKQVQWLRWFWGLIALLVMLGLWNCYRMFALPEPIDTQLEYAVRHGAEFGNIHNVDQVSAVKMWFMGAYGSGAILCSLGIAGWWFLWRGKIAQPKLACFLGGFLVCDLLWFGYGRAAQCDPALYYPKIPVLAKVAHANAGRIAGCGCLPARLAEMCGLHDIRGYDAVDPMRLMEIMSLAAKPDSTKLSYAATQWFVPRGSYLPPDGVRLSPILDMLGVRYVIFRGSPPSSMQPVFQQDDYWVLINHEALPRVFVPKHVEVVTNERTRLEKLASANFDPRETAYVESPVAFPELSKGSAEIVNEIPARVTISTKMETPGLVVLADLWDKGWNAYLDNRPVPILRTNHAIRSVVVPTGEARLEFRYEPASLRLGLWLFALATVTLAGWFAVIRLCNRAAMQIRLSPASKTD